MRILAFDCAGTQCAAAVVADDRTLAARQITAERGHAQMLVPLLTELLAEAGLTFEAVDRFSVTTGPGSFTGIRVALAAARGLALATGKPVVGFTTFEAFARAAVDMGLDAPRLLVAIESRRAECFVQLFDRNGAPLGDPDMMPPEAIGGWVGPGGLALAGDAAARLAPYVDAPVMPELAAVDPAVLARLARLRPTGAPPSPFYLRPPDAVPARRR